MTMRFLPNLAISSTDAALKFLFEFLDFMRTASPVGPGWTISRSSDGTVGGAGDNISAYGDLTHYTAGVSESWFVLRQPDGGREFLWFRTNTTDTNWSLSYSPSGAYTGGDAGNPATAVDAVVIHGTDAILPVANQVVHVGADDAAPYGWFTYVNLSGSLSTGRGCYAMIPITDGTQAGETDPIVFYYDGGTNGYPANILGSETVTPTNGRIGGFVPGSATWAAMPALQLNVTTSAVFPDGCAQDDNGEDVSAPVSFARRASLPAPQGFKGFTDFMQWNGTVRAPGETFETLTRVSWGAVNFPWDGVTTPSAT